MKGLSKRQMVLKYGFNARLVETLIKEDVLQILPGCTPLRPKVDPASLERLREGEHYVICQECGAYQAQVTSGHLRMCSGTTLGEYQEKYPGSPIMASLCMSNKAKTEEQKQAQSFKLKERFKTHEGEKTRKQIQKTSLDMMAGPYREQAAQHLRKLNSSPEMREWHREDTQARWGDGSLREAVEGWHRDHRGASLASAAHARKHIKKHFTKLHQRLKTALKRAGLKTVTEYGAGYYSIDEAIPELKIAIEADGCYWHGCETCGFDGRPEIHRTDKSKTTYLIRKGWVILRFPGHEINENPDRCAQQVVEQVRICQREVA